MVILFVLQHPIFDILFREVLLVEPKKNGLLLLEKEGWIPKKNNNRITKMVNFVFINLVFSD